MAQTSYLIPTPKRAGTRSNHPAEEALVAGTDKKHRYTHMRGIEQLVDIELGWRYIMQCNEINRKGGGDGEKERGGEGEKQ